MRLVGTELPACLAVFESVLLSGNVEDSWLTAADVLDRVLAEFAGVPEAT